MLRFFGYLVVKGTQFFNREGTVSFIPKSHISQTSLIFTLTRSSFPMFSSTEWCLPWVDNVQFQSRETQMERRHCSRYDFKMKGNIHQLMEEFCVLFRKVGLTGRRELAVLRNLQQLAVNCLKSLFCLTPCNRSRGILHCSGQL